MCRLFGMSGGSRPVRATFWLLEAPDSLAVQSRKEPDGTGLGTFAADGTPEIHKWPVAAYKDRAFALEAREVESTNFVAHIRYASTGSLELKNTHPFEQNGRIFAHNGVIQDLARLEEELGSARSLVQGDTDSERFFALITRHIDSNGGDVGAGLTTAARWVAENLPLYAINIILATAHQLWALRYPQTHELFFLERPSGGQHGCRQLEVTSAAGAMRVRSDHLARHPAVIVASERLDESPDWQPLACGELLHVSSDLTVEREVILDAPPAKLLSLDDLDSRAAESQQAHLQGPR
jgi:predicted glutamine amidotransferase